MTATDNRTVFDLPNVRTFLETLEPEERREVELYLAMGGDPYDPDAAMSANERHNQVINNATALLVRLAREYPAAIYREMSLYLPKAAGDNRPVLRRPQAESGDPDAVDLSDETDPPFSVTKAYQPDIIFVRNTIQQAVLPSYFIGRDGVAPHVLIEVGSPGTFRFDVQRKPAIYCVGMDVAEYYSFNPPYGKRRKAGLRGWRRIGMTYQEVALNAKGRLWSDALQSWVGTDDLPGFEWRLWLWDKDGNRRITDLEAAEARAETEARRANVAEARAETAEAEIARLRDELRRAQGGMA